MTSEYTPTRSEATLQELADAVVTSLLNKIKSGEAAAAEIEVARKLLSEAGVRVIPVKGTPSAALAAAVSEIPLDEEEDDVLPFPPSRLAK